MQDAEYASLSTRQAEIAQMVVSGKSTREIALALTLSPRTVETHIGAIYNKYGVSSRAELILAVLGPSSRSNENPPVAANFINTNLPVPRAALLGRATDVANIVNLMRESRLVTLTGAGGVGKTRAALAVGEAVLADFHAGVWFVELAALARGSSAADAVARALSIEPSAREPLIESLRIRLRRKSLVIILDNCEHLVTEAAALADALLRDCGQVRMLATSREPLRIAGERTYRLPSLRIPSSADSLALDAARGAAYASIELFAERAQAVDYDFALTDENIPFVAEICRRVDGIPLAIELAAARVSILPVNALATKLESHLRILGTGDRIALPRHQTMHAMIDWSYELLEPQEQRLFERLSIFSGGCALPEAVAVYGDDTVDEVVVLDVLSSLVDKSLVIADASGPQPRYGLLQTFAQYGLEKLAARGDAATAARRHAVAYVNVAERLEAEYDAVPSTSWFARAEREVGNWRAALAWTLEARHDVLLGQRLFAAMRPLWWEIQGAQRWLRLACDLIDERTPQKVAAAVHFTTVYVNFESGELERTIADCRQLGEIYKKIDDPLRTAYLQTWEGISLFLLGRLAEAEPLLASALDLARKHTQVSLSACALGFMAQVSFKRGDVFHGRAKFAESIALYESIGAERLSTRCRMNLAEAEFGCGNIDAAIQLATSTLMTIRRVGKERGRAVALGLANLAGYCIAAERWTDAREYAREAVKVMQETQDHLVFLTTLEHIAAVAALAPSDTNGPAQTAQAAAMLLGYTNARFRHLSYSREPNEQREYDRVLDTLRETYDEADLATHLASGAGLHPDRAVELALSM